LTITKYLIHTRLTLIELNLIKLNKIRVEFIPQSEIEIPPFNLHL